MIFNVICSIFLNSKNSKIPNLSPTGAGDSASDTASTQGGATQANGVVSENGDKDEADDTGAETESMDDTKLESKADTKADQVAPDSENKAAEDSQEPGRGGRPPSDLVTIIVFILKEHVLLDLFKV